MERDKLIEKHLFYSIFNRSILSFEKGMFSLEELDGLKIDIDL